MRLVWMVLAVLTVLAGPASADRITCQCRAGTVLPERGATGVPTNTKMWRLYDSSDVHRARPVADRDLLGIDVIERPFAANAEIRDANGVLFTTGADRDDTPPAAPENVTVSFTTDADGDYAEVTSAFIGGTFDADTALVRLDIYDGGGVISTITHRNRRFLCEPSLRLASRNVDVDVRALDLAGNASPPVRVHAYVETSATDTSRCNTSTDDAAAFSSERYGTRCGNPLVILVFLAYPMVLVVWVLFVLVARACIRRHPIEPLSILHADAVVHRLIRRQYVWIAFVIAGVAWTITSLGHDAAVFTAPWVFSAVGKLVMQRRALALLDRADADAVRRGPWLTVTSRQSSITISASPGAFTAGKREALPRSQAL